MRMQFHFLDIPQHSVHPKDPDSIPLLAEKRTKNNVGSTTRAISWLP